MGARNHFDWNTGSFQQMAGKLELTCEEGKIFHNLTESFSKVGQIGDSFVHKVATSSQEEACILFDSTQSGPERCHP